MRNDMPDELRRSTVVVRRRTVPGSGWLRMVATLPVVPFGASVAALAMPLPHATARLLPGKLPPLLAASFTAALSACRADPAALDTPTRARLAELDQRSPSAPESLDAGECLALAQLADGQLKDAAARFDRLAARAAASAPRAGSAAQQTGHDVVTLAPATPEMNARIAGDAGRAARAWLDAGVPRMAEMSARTALAREPMDLGLQILLARALLSQNRPADALAALAVLPSRVEADPDRVEQLALAWTLRAGASRRLGDYSTALHDVSTALTMSPDDPDAILERGIIRARGGNLPAARLDWEKVIDLAPDSHAAYLARQDEYLLAADPDQP